MIKPTLYTALGLMSILASQAAVISWSAGTAAIDSTAVSQNGTFVLGQNAGNGTTTTIGDTTFASGNAGGVPGGNQTFYSGADATFNQLFGSVDWLTSESPINIEFAVTAGTEYEIQVFLADTRPGNNTEGAVDGLALASIQENPLSFIGTFTADGPTQTFTSVGNSNTGLWINAYQVRAIAAVPEPSSTALLGLGGLALMIQRRR